MPFLFSFNIRLILVLVFISCMVVKYCASNDLNQDFDITWGNERGKILNNGEILTLTLDNISGSGFQSKKEYLFGKIDMQIKLVQGNSAGTVTAYYVIFYFYKKKSKKLAIFVNCYVFFNVGIFFFFNLVVITRIKS